MLVKIFSFAGTRKSDEWPSLLQLPQFRAFINSTRLQPNKCQWPNLTAEAQPFVLETLKPCPSQRWSALTALKHKLLLATGSDHVGGGDKGEEGWVKVEEVASLMGSAAVEGRCKANTT